MGWFDGWFSSEAGKGTGDPLRQLDPKLREFLERESPVKIQPQAPRPAESTSAQAPNRASIASASADASTATESPNGVPRESLFQDGRYAHLWKTYRPIAAIEAEGKTDQEKMMDVLDGYKERKAQIGRAALENCADEQIDWRSCMASPDWKERMTMCRSQVRKFERCFAVQSRLLKSLGYISVIDRSADVDEQIQMHADTLYHQMLDREAAIAKAKKEGTPVPDFAPLIPEPASSARGEDEVSPELQKQWQKKLKKVKEEDREAEENALKAEHRATREVAEKIQSIWDEQAKERASRKEKGQDSVLDKLASLVGK